MKKKPIAGILLFTVFLVLLGCSNREREEKAYEVKIRGLRNVIVKAASSYINFSRSYVTIWEYAKVTGMDFETAYAELQGDRGEKARRYFGENRANIKRIVGTLSDPPLKFSKCYKRLVELYGIYEDLHTLTLNPSGTEEEFNDSINGLHTEFVEKLEELDLLLMKIY